MKSLDWSSGTSSRPHLHNKWHTGDPPPFSAGLPVSGLTEVAAAVHRSCQQPSGSVSPVMSCARLCLPASHHPDAAEYRLPPTDLPLVIG